MSVDWPNVKAKLKNTGAALLAKRRAPGNRVRPSGAEAWQLLQIRNQAALFRLPAEALAREPA
jgi:hypothetical protein